jgi:hypothetical protein
LAFVARRYRKYPRTIATVVVTKRNVAAALTASVGDPWKLQILTDNGPLLAATRGTGP